MSAFESAAARGDAVGAFQRAFVNGALWATALAWANAIREVTRAFLPDDTEEIVFGEVLAASITTLLAIAAAIVVLYCCASKRPARSIGASDGARAKGRRASAGERARATKAHQTKEQTRRSSRESV